jgi:hypothetical protein
VSVRASTYSETKTLSMDFPGFAAGCAVREKNSLVWALTAKFIDVNLNNRITWAIFLTARSGLGRANQAVTRTIASISV